MYSAPLNNKTMHYLQYTKPGPIEFSLPFEEVPPRIGMRLRKNAK
jgi:hypothetical protein